MEKTKNVADMMTVIFAP